MASGDREYVLYLKGEEVVVVAVGRKKAVGRKGNKSTAAPEHYGCWP